MTTTDFDNSVSNLDSKFAANKTRNESIYNELKKLKYLIQAILEVKITLKKMIDKII